MGFSFKWSGEQEVVAKCFQQYSQGEIFKTSFFLPLIKRQKVLLDSKGTKKAVFKFQLKEEKYYTKTKTHYKTDLECTIQTVNLLTKSNRE